ncbi:MAG: fibronectin type III domain-containing protein [Eubacterium sp.]|nr:fibronectin type III domain-containing protein [Eubacterium sp.]
MHFIKVIITILISSISLNGTPRDTSVNMGALLSLAGRSIQAEVVPTAIPEPGYTETPVDTALPETTAEPSPTPDQVIAMTVTESPQTMVLGQTVDVTRFKLNVVYVSGASQIVTPESVTLDTSHTGMQIAALYYGGSTVSTTVQILPRSPQGLKLSEGTMNSVRLSWDRLDEAIRYQVELKKNASDPYTLIETTTEPTRVFTDMTQGQLWYVRIRAVSEDGYNAADGTYSVVSGESAYSAEFAIAPRPNDMNGLISAKKIYRKSMTLAWDPVVGATGYKIYYRLSTEDEYSVAGTSAETKYKVTGLKAGCDYYFKIAPFAAQQENEGGSSPESYYGTAPSLPTITARGGEGLIRVNYTGGKSADEVKLFISEEEDGEYTLAYTFKSPQFKVTSIHDLEDDTTYYVKLVAERTVSDILVSCESDIEEVSTGEVSSTSTDPKLYKTKKKFMKSPAVKNYKDFKKALNYKKSFPIPGMINTNAGGFNASNMVPQSMTMYGSYLLITAYDIGKTNDSVIYVLNKSSRELLTLILLPHKGHVGGITSDGTNIWLAYGKKLQCFKGKVISDAVNSGEDYYELYSFNNTVATDETISYITYYKGRVWAGAYDELKSKNVYVYSITDKSGDTPALNKTGQMMLPNRAQGLAFTKGGQMIVSRSCQTDKTQRGFMSKLEVYEPDIDMDSAMERGDKVSEFKMPPMNEDILIYGKYTYVIFESCALSRCEAPIDRVTAIKTGKITG